MLFRSCVFYWISLCNVYNCYLAGDYHENPFASTQSLDANPFDDPTPYTSESTSKFPSSSAESHTARAEELTRRERDLERRETELAQKSDHIRKNGRNNWPFCMSPSASSFLIEF